MVFLPVVTQWPIHNTVPITLIIKPKWHYVTTVRLVLTFLTQLAGLSSDPSLFLFQKLQTVSFWQARINMLINPTVFASTVILHCEEFPEATDKARTDWRAQWGTKDQLCFALLLLWHPHFGRTSPRDVYSYATWGLLFLPHAKNNALPSVHS